MRKFIEGFIVVFLVYCPLKASEFKKAVELPADDLKVVTKLIQSGPSSDFISRRIETEGTTYGYVALLPGNNRFLVSFNDFSPFSDLSQFFLGCQKSAREYGFNGNLDGRICFVEKKVRSMVRNLPLEILYSQVRGAASERLGEYDYIFCGYGSGGALASLAAAYFSRENTVKENQVKVITFSSAGLGDQEFLRNYNDQIPSYNSLNFRRHLDLSISRLYAAGMPVEMTAMEGVFDHVSAPRRAIQKLVWGAVIAAGTYGVVSLFKLTQVFVSVTALLQNIEETVSTVQQDLGKIKQMAQNTTEGVIESVQQDLQKVRHLTGGFNEITRAAQQSAQALKLGVAALAPLPIYGLWRVLRMTDLPSDELIKSALIYTRSRYQVLSPDDYDYLEDMGKISWFGSR